MSIAAWPSRRESSVEGPTSSERVSIRGDVAAANLTVTPERLAIVDFTEPLMRDVSEIVVTGPGAPALEAVSDLSGRELCLHESSSYWSTIERLNEGLRRVGKSAVRLEPVGPFIEGRSDHPDLSCRSTRPPAAIIVGQPGKARLAGRLRARVH